MDEEGKSDIIAFKETLKQYAAACNAGDFDHWISLWADNGVQMPADHPAAIGKERIRETMKPLFDQFTLKIDIKDITEARIFGNYGLTRCTYTLELIPKAGGETIHAMPDGKEKTIVSHTW